MRNVPLEEGEISYENAEVAALKAEEIGIDSIWVPDHLLNPIKGENVGCLEAWFKREFEAYGVSWHDHD